jgi:hypothetical protein
MRMMILATKLPTYDSCACLVAVVPLEESEAGKDLCRRNSFASI